MLYVMDTGTISISYIFQGMIFIHDSEIGVHGNLKSSNCVVDSKWVLMVTDFGLHQLVNERSGSGSDLKKYYERKLVFIFVYILFC